MSTVAGQAHAVARSARLLRVPEGLEVELYRRAADALVGRRVAAVRADDLVADPDVAAALTGAVVRGVSRIGKLLVLDTSGPRVGVHFGMTGRIVVDGCAPIEQLEYGARRDDPRWDRFVIDLVDGGRMRVNDPRRWARVRLEPDVDGFGPDLLDASADDVGRALAGTRAPVKAALLDQRRIAGLGNLCVDEVLFHAGVAPQRRATDLLDDDVAALHQAMVERLPIMLELGGSHRGVLSPEVRAASGTCAFDGAALERDRVAGRTTLWCPAHQR